MKKILFVLSFLIIFSTACTLDKSKPANETSNTPSVVNDSSPELALECEECDISQSLKLLQNIKGVNPDKFYYGPCIYLHGDDSKIRNWVNFDILKKEKLVQLFNEVPLVKLDYSSNPNNISDELYIGPICNCTQYNQAVEKINKYELDFQWKLAHGDDDLSSCVDFSDFK